jgi:DNA polymerase (family 10)
MVDNVDVVRTLERVADLLEIRGENTFKVRAYRMAAAQVDNLGEPLADIAARDGGLRGLDGFGRAIAEKVAELLDTGRLQYLEQLEEDVPPTLLALCELPGVGPRTAAQLWKEGGISTIDELDAAARGGRLSGMPRLGAKSVERIVAALDARRVHGARERRPRERVRSLAEALVAALRALPGADRVEVAGSFRRQRATVKDLDIVVATRDPHGVLVSLAALPQVERVLARGGTKCSIEADSGFQIDCRAVAPEEFGSALQYFTGSQTHNVRLRARALRMGMTLNEYGLFRLEDDERVAGDEEAAVYAALGLRWIAPERREDRGEIDDAADVSVAVAGASARAQARRAQERSRRERQVV